METTARCRLVLADDHRVVRQLLTELILKAADDCKIVGEAASLKSALQISQKTEATLLILSLGLFRNGGAREMETASAEGRQPCETLVYGCSGTTDAEIMRAIRLGVSGCIGSHSETTELLHAIKEICAGKKYFCSGCGSLLAEVTNGHRHAHPPFGGLSKRERQILLLISEGNTSKQIAHLLGLSLATVNTHRRNAMEKAKARNAADLIRFGRRHDLLHHES